MILLQNGLHSVVAIEESIKQIKKLLKKQQVDLELSIKESEKCKWQLEDTFEGVVSHYAKIEVGVRELYDQRLAQSDRLETNDVLLCDLADLIFSVKAQLQGSKSVVLDELRKLKLDEILPEPMRTTLGIYAYLMQQDGNVVVNESSQPYYNWDTESSWPLIISQVITPDFVDVVTAWDVAEAVSRDGENQQVQMGAKHHAIQL